MDSFNETSGFCYNPNSSTNGESEFSGLLEIYVSHARNIHNICIYDKQDVYAKFSLTYNPDETISTRIVNGGGKNPQFNENLRMKVTQLDAVLKCEIWMLSRARNYLDDQLLGFTLVPMSLVAGKGKVTQDFTLSSTDLFHSPAGTVQLTLFLNTNLPINLSSKLSSNSGLNSSIMSEVVLLDCGQSEVSHDPVEYGRIEFPDVNVVRENQQMVSEYFHNSALTPILCGRSGLSFLNLQTSSEQSQSPDDFDMNLNSGGSVSPNGSTQNSGFFSSTTTSLSDDRNSFESTGKKKNHGAIAHSSSSSHVASMSGGPNNQNLGASPDTPTSKKEIMGIIRSDKEEDFPNKEGERSKENDVGSSEFGRVFAAPLGNINLEAEQTAMQKQIVDMYMRSMQQFTESLAKMKLPMDLDKPEADNHHGDVIQNHKKKIDVDKKKDGSRLFYGSRAFF